MIFLSKIIEFWKIVNVHGPYRDIRLRDADRAAIYSAEDMNLQKLSEFSDFVEQYLTPSSSKLRVKNLQKTHPTISFILARDWSNLQYTYCRLTMIMFVLENIPLII